MAANSPSCLSPVSTPQLLDIPHQPERKQVCEDYLDRNVWDRIFPEYSFTELICQTDGSLVWLGHNRATLRRLALKITETIQKGSSVLLHQQRQKAFVTSAQLKSMVKTLQIKENGAYRLVVMEYYPWSLADLLACYTKSTQHRLTESHFNFIVYAFNGILDAVAELHQLGYVHRDLKLDNFMVDQNLNICLNDFELVTKELVVDGSLSGTLQYMAPERLSKKRMTEPVNKAVDIWSLGIILYQLFTGETPFRGSNSEELLDDIYQGYLKTKEIPQEMLHLIKQMLQIRSEKRVEVQQIKKTSFLGREVDMNVLKSMVPH